MEETPTAGAPPQPQGPEQRKMLAREYRKVGQRLALLDPDPKLAPDPNPNPNPVADPNPKLARDP